MSTKKSLDYQSKVADSRSESPPDLRCPRCTSQMVRGCLVDRADQGFVLQTEWVEGSPHTSWIGSIKTAVESDYRWKHTEVFGVGASSSTRERSNREQFNAGPGESRGASHRME